MAQQDETTWFLGLISGVHSKAVTKTRMVADACDPSPQTAKAGRLSRVGGNSTHSQPTYCPLVLKALSQT